VTNLRDDGPGSLRHGIDTAEGPRTIVFDVAGRLQHVTPLAMENKSCITIAGQTAPPGLVVDREQDMHSRR